MSYASFEQVILRYPIIKTWSVDSSDVKSDLLDFADIEIDSALTPEYSTPFSDTPPIVRDLSIDMAYLKLLIRQDIEKGLAFQEYLYGRIEKLKSGKSGIITDSGTIIDKNNAGMGVWSTTGDYNPTESMLDADNPYTAIDSGYIDHLEDIRS